MKYHLLNYNIEGVHFITCLMRSYIESIIFIIRDHGLACLLCSVSLVSLVTNVYGHLFTSIIELLDAIINIINEFILSLDKDYYTVIGPR